MDALGPRIRKQRRQLGLTLDELAGRTGISKPYLSLIETGRVPNPPSDEKLRRLEQTLGFGGGELLTQAHLLRTPHDVRMILGKLLGQKDSQTTPATATDGAVLGDSDSAAEAAYLSGVLGNLADGNRSRGELRVTDAFVPFPDLSDKDAFAVRIADDIMAPKYRQDDIVIFSPALPPRNGDDCFIRFADGQTTFQRIFFETDNKNIPLIRLQPHNETHRPTVVPSERISAIYRALHRYRRVNDDG